MCWTGLSWTAQDWRGCWGGGGEGGDAAGEHTIGGLGDENGNQVSAGMTLGPYLSTVENCRTQTIHYYI